jgi:hypothetical protein
VRLICYVILIGVAVGASSSTVWTTRHTLFEQFAVLWTVSDPTDAADAAVILGGGVERRSKIAADLYNKGVVKHILISDVIDSSNAIVGGHSSDTAIGREILRRNEIPNDAVETFGSGNQNTQEEALALTEWSTRHSATSFIIPTEFLFARRVKLIFNRKLARRNARISVIAFEATNYNHKNWWKTKEGQRAFKTELLKYFYYLIFYL